MNNLIYWQSLYHWESNSILSGIGFQMIWKDVPDDMEQGSIYAKIRRVIKKLTARTCLTCFRSKCFANRAVRKRFVGA